jgi:DNA-binding HxlR family transcriptional regulator
MEHEWRSPCPLGRTLDLVGDRWTLLVMRDLLAGKSHFSELRDSPERIATNILSDRLKKLVAHGLVERFPSDRFPGRRAYRLTDAGRSLEPAMRAFADWGLAHIEGAQALVRTG